MGSIASRMEGGNQGHDMWDETARESNGSSLVTVRARVESSQQQGNSPADVTDLVCSLKQSSSYGFSYDIIYSTAGLLVGCQFAVDFTGTLTSIAYGITLNTIGNAIVSDATTTKNTFLGSGASLAGGGPKTARVFGSIKTASGGGGDLKLRLQATGLLGVNVTIQPGSNGAVEEQ